MAQGGTAAGFSATAVEAWGVNEVCSWLESIQVPPGAMPGAVTVFRENQMQGLDLLDLTPEDMKNDLGIAQLGLRNAIRRGLEKLRGSRCGVRIIFHIGFFHIATRLHLFV